MAVVTVFVDPGAPVRPYYSPAGDRPGWRSLASIIVEGRESDLIVLGDGSPAGIIAACGAMIDALASLRTQAQAELAQGWAEPEADGPLAESELRALAGDR